MKILTAVLLICIAVLGFRPAPAGDCLYTVTSVCDSGLSVSQYPAFAEEGEISLLIPGLKEGWVPQGITWLPAQNWFLLAGYHTDRRPSSLIAVDAESNQIVKAVRLKNLDGSYYTGHAGGVCATERDIYVSNNRRLYRLSLDTFLNLTADSVCAFEQEIAVPSNASYCSYADGVLWVGEFQYGTGYPTDPSHRLKLGRDTLKAWLCGYRLANGEISAHAAGADTAVPDFIFATSERIQGMTVYQDKIWLSQSYGRRNSSSLLGYAYPRDDPDMHVTVSGTEVPVWFLIGSRLTDNTICPPMTECICTAGDGMYLLFESAAEKYMDPDNASRFPMDRLFRIN